MKQWDVMQLAETNGGEWFLEVSVSPGGGDGWHEPRYGPEIGDTGDLTYLPYGGKERVVTGWKARVALEYFNRRDQSGTSIMERAESYFHEMYEPDDYDPREDMGYDRW